MIEFASIPVSSEMKAFREPRLQGIEVSTQCVIHECQGQSHRAISYRVMPGSKVLPFSAVHISMPNVYEVNTDEEVVGGELHP